MGHEKAASWLSTHAVQHAQNSNGDDECHPRDCLWPKTTATDQSLLDDYSDALGFSAPPTSFTEPQNSLAQPHTASTDDAELPVDLSGTSDFPFTSYVWDPSFDMSTANDHAGFPQQEAFLDPLALDFTRDIAPFAKTDVDILNQSSAGLRVAEVVAMTVVYASNELPLF